MSSSVHIDNKKRHFSIPGPKQGLNDKTLTVKKKYLIHFTKSRKKFCLSFYYIGANSYSFVNGTNIHKFKAKDSEIYAVTLRD